jgi:membrane protease YdiL (CAAX protease family)
VPDYEIISPKRKRKQQYVAFGLVYAIIAFAILINAETLFDYWDSSWTYTTLFYMVGVAIFLASAEKLPEDLRKPAIHSIYGFLIATPAFMLGFIGLQQAGILVVEYRMPVYLLLPTFAFQLCIVATSEELIFRVAVFRALHRIRWYFAYIGSSLLFGVFHWAAYGGNVQLVLFAVVMGLLFAFIADKINLGVAVSLHFVWNFGLMGGLLFN